LHLQQQNGGEGKSMYTLTDIVHQSFSGFLIFIWDFPGFYGREGSEFWLFMGNLQISKAKIHFFSVLNTHNRQTYN